MSSEAESQPGINGSFTRRFARLLMRWLFSTIAQLLLITVVILLAIGYQSPSLPLRVLCTAGLVCVGLLAIAACLGYLIFESRRGDRIDKVLSFFLGSVMLVVCVIGTLVVIGGFIRSLSPAT
jgi:hypothetical protein